MPTNIDSLSVQIKASSRSATNQVNKLIQSLEKLKVTLSGDTNAKLTKFADELERIGNASTKLNQVSTGLKKTADAAGKAADKMKDQAKSTDKVIGSFTELYSKLRLISGSIRLVSRTIAGWINESNEYVENLNLFTVAMGQYSQSAYDYAQKVSEVMGIDPSDWMRNQGVFMTLAKGFGVAGDRAAVMSQQLTQLGYDISSLYNIKVEDSMQKLQSALAGELEPVRRLGYDLSQTKLQAIAASLGINKLYREMTQAEKSQLRYYALMTQVTQAQGDMARTLNAPANQLRVLRAQVTQAARALGNIFIPILNAVLPFAIALAKGIRLVANEIANLLGFKLPEVDYSGLQTSTVDVGNVLEDVGDDVADTYDNVSDSVEHATQKIKEFKRYVLAFDELNKIPGQDDDNTSSSGSGSSGGKPSSGSGITAGSAGSDWNFPLPTYDFLSGAVESQSDAILNTIKDMFPKIEAVVSSFALGLGAILALTGVNIPLGVDLMALGAAGLFAAAAIDWGYFNREISFTLRDIFQIVFGAMLAVGAILTLTHANVPLGLGLMAAGFAGSYALKQAEWGWLNTEVYTSLSQIAKLASMAMTAVGLILVLTNANVPLGLGLLAAGVVGHAITADWQSMGLSVYEAIKNVVQIASKMAMGLGLILLMSNANVPLGLGLLAAGAVGQSFVANWDQMATDIYGALKKVFNVAVMATFAVGAILALSSANVPLGIGLMAAGMVGKIVELHWDQLSTDVYGALKSIFNVVTMATFAVGTILALSGANIPLGIGLMVAGAVGKIVELHWDALAQDTYHALRSVVAITSRMMFAVGAILALSGVATGMGIAMMAAGFAGQAYLAKDEWASFLSKLEIRLGEAKQNIIDWWNGVKLWWGQKKNNVLEAKAKLKEKASDLWETLRTGWEELDAKVFEVSVELVTLAQDLWNKLTEGWNNLMASGQNFLEVTIKPKLIGLAEGAWEGVKSGAGWVKDRGTDLWNWLFPSASAEGMEGASGDFQIPTLDVGLQITGAMEKAKQAVADGWVAIKENTAQSMLDFQTLILNGLGNIETHLPIRFATYDGLITVGWGTIQSHTLTAWVDIFALITNYLVNIETGIGLKMSTYQEAVNAGWDAITTNTTTAWSQIFTQVTNYLVNIETGIGLKMTVYVNKVQAGWAAVVTATNSKWHDVQTQVMNALTNLEKGVSTKMASIVKTAQNVKWNGIGQNIINGIAAGINWGWNWLNDMVWNLAMSLYNTACYALGIASPSKLFEHGVGEMVGEGIAKGLDNSENGVLASIDRIAQDMSDEFANTEAKANFSANLGGSIYSGAARSAASVSASGRSNEENDSWMLAEYVRSGIHDATYSQNELLREQNRILQALLEKPFVAEVSTNSIVHGLQRKNKRDGTTVVPVLG